MRGKVVDVENLGEDLIKTRGENCKNQIEPKLNQLSQRFEMVSRRILHGQVTKIVEACCFLSNFNRIWELRSNILIILYVIFM